MGKANNAKVHDLSSQQNSEGMKPKDKPKITGNLNPLNQRQKEYINAINVYPLTIAIGVWGSSKTYIPAVMAADMLVDKGCSIDKIVIARPAEGKGKSLGFFKGDKNEKLDEWVEPVTRTLKGRLGESFYNYLLATEKIELLALEQVKGRSYDDTFFIIDEAEDLEADVAKSLVGRQGIRSKVVIAGDLAQADIKKYSGLHLLLDVARSEELDVPLINFDSWDYCVRSDEAKKWGMAFESYENKSKNK